MLNWYYFPKSNSIPRHLQKTVTAFEKKYKKFQSDKFQFGSDKVLSLICKDLEEIGYVIEKSKKAKDKIRIPVLFGLNGKLEKSFEADGFDQNTNTVLEVEAGRAVTNYQFLKDLFQACMMHDTNFLVVAVRRTYRSNKDFDKVVAFFETMYASDRLKLPLEGILIIGY